MLLTVTNTARPATDLGYLLHKHPDRHQTIELSSGIAHIFYPEASEERCTAALMLELDPVGIVRGSGGSATGLLNAYVNDRPYTSSSFMSVAISRAFRTAMNGRCDSKPELAQTPLPLEIHIAALPCNSGSQLVERLFEPLGYTVSAATEALDSTFPDWGQSPYLSVTLSGEVTLQRALQHLYVLIPVLDNEKHYWVGADEVEKLVRRSEEWLKGHPEKEFIVQRYLRYQSRLTREALARLTEADVDADAQTKDAAEDALESAISLNQLRIDAVVAAVRETGAHHVVDLGCGEGKYLRALLEIRTISRICGMDVSCTALARAEQRLKLDRMPSRQRERISLIQGSLLYKDRRLKCFDAAILAEVVEHLDAPRLATFERNIFEFARPRTLVVTTPNREYNALFDNLRNGGMRHPDHRFEWTRDEFKEWCARIADSYGYAYILRPVGPEDPAYGPPTQMSIFTDSKNPS